MTEQVSARRILLAPLDPVHDVGLKLIAKALDERGHHTVLLSPDVTAEEVINTALEHDVDTLLVSRTIGYGVDKALGRLVDLAEASGLRDRARLVAGGMAIKPEFVAELGFDAAFGPGTEVERAVAYVEERPYIPQADRAQKEKRDITAGYDYHFHHQAIADLLDQIVDMILDEAQDKTSPGVQRTQLRDEMLTVQHQQAQGEISASQAEELQRTLRLAYSRHCEELITAFYAGGRMPPRTRTLTGSEVANLIAQVNQIKGQWASPRLQHVAGQPLIFVQYGTGCPAMDVLHMKVAEGWGADGIIHFDPSWEARSEGLIEGYVAHHESGTLVTFENLKLMKDALEPATIYQVRAHRGLNTSEMALLAGHAGADMTKVNIIYGSLCGGTDPERLMVDGIEVLRIAARFGMPIDVPANEELSGVPAYKTFASMLIGAKLALRLGARPVLQPLLCYAPDIMIGGQMADNYVDFNAAKFWALQRIVQAPIWPGAPVGFFTHTEDRVQSAVTTALHTALTASLGAGMVIIASVDEAYAGGPIAATSRIDALRAVQEVFRFFGHATIQPTPQAELWADELVDNIEGQLRRVAQAESFTYCLYNDVLATRREGAHPGRFGQGTVTEA
jgi:methylmalonyl-CoA mutase cobalamin-binding domain/chain